MVFKKNALQSLTKNLRDAFIFHKIVTNSEGKPVDYVFLDVNPAFERMTGLSINKVIGKKASDILPDIINSSFDWIDACNKVSELNDNRCFEQYFKHTSKWYEATVWCEEPGYIYLLFRDITTYKQNKPEPEEEGKLGTIARDINIQKTQEQELKDSEARLKSYISNAPYGIFIHDENGVYLEVNELACQMTGYSEEELVGMNLLQLIPKNKHEWIINQRSKLIDEENIYLETPYIRKDGSMLEWGINSIKLSDTLFYGFTRDITEDKQAERIMEARLKLLSFATNNTHEKVLQKTIDEVCALLDSPIGFYHFVSADEKMLTLKAWSTATVQKHCKILDEKGMHYELDQAGVWVDCVRERRPIIHNDYASLSHRKGMPEGHALVIRQLVVPVMRQDRIVAILGVGNKPQDYIDKDIQTISLFADLAWDICERKQIEKVLGYEREVYKQILEQSLAGYWDWMIQEETEYLSPTFKSMFGYADHELPNTPNSWKKLIFEEDLLRVIDTFNKHVESHGKIPYYSEIRYRHKNGSTVWVICTGKVIEWDQKGKPVRMIGCHVNITERKQVEEELYHSYQFEKLVSEISSMFLNLSSENIDEGINYTLKLMGEFFDVGSCCVFQFSADGKTCSKTHEWCAEGIESNINQAQNINLEKLSWWWTEIHNNGYVYVPDVSKLPNEATAEKEELQKHGIKSLLDVQLRYKGKLIGFLGFDSVKEKKEWGNKETYLLEIIAGILVSAFKRSDTEQVIHNYTLKLEHLYHQLDSQIDKARQIHEHTISKTLPDIENLAFATYYNPAAKMGGDFYDIVKKEEKVILYLSDVMGHGLDSAILSIFVKNTVNNYIALSSKDKLIPKNILEFLFNQYCRENYPQDYFISIFMLVIDLNSMELTYTAAGFQTPPSLVTESGKKVILKSEGLPISSAFAPELFSFEENHTKLRPGDTIMLSTDGLLEATVNGQMYKERAEKVFYENKHLSPEAIVQAINDDFYCFNNESLETEDDVTFCIIQVNTEKK